MPNLLEVTGEDITRLDDASLRALIGLLCEADYRSAGLPTKGILWGGNLDASDGGLDVVVRGEVDPPHNSFIPRKRTGFQVKKPDMPRAEILKEMQPGGSLRDEIKDLIAARGAYIIVSSTGSTTDTALRNRIDAMKVAVSKEKDHGNLFLDFYDRGRIATWVRSHPTLLLWVRNKVGRQLTGWRPYENWANAPGGVEEEYLLDDGLRLHDGTRPRDGGMSIEDGLLRLRTALSTPGTSVRLAGLSGVGKTRLVQALFDERLGNQALNLSQVFYADISDGPNPDPRSLAEQLIADKSRAIMIVDNCPPDLHRRLTKTCSKTHSTISLLTVEYDIRDDLPEETSVFRLEPASEDLIEKIIRNRFPYISEVDARTIAIFSGGNARVAIALANTVQKGETLSGFHDEELFQRLFRQRHDSSESLLRSAEVGSLVYSFEGTDVDSTKSELKFFSSLIGTSALELYRDVNTLKERGLVQSRNVWRAVLPHAIANRLAKRALEFIPKSKIVQAFLSEGSERLIKSFTRRLSYLHDNETAISIVNEWLSQDGWLGKENCKFNSFGMEVFKNIAPVSPKGVLYAIERAANGSDGNSFTSRDNPHYYDFVTVLRHLAYDQEIFCRSINLICRFALSEKPGENHNSIRNVAKSLYYIYLSGTHATADVRASVIKELIAAGDQDRQQLGLYLLDATLEAWHFSASSDFDFGARPRDFGFLPRSRKDISDWYETFIDICTQAAISDSPIAQDARKILSNNIRGLWTKAGMYEALERSAKLIHEQQPWNEGWVQVRGIMRYDAKGFEKKVTERLHNLEKLLSPKDLLERARTFALAKDHCTFDLVDALDKEDDASSAWHRTEEATRQIGIEVANDNETLRALLPELVSQHSIRLNTFGKGLAAGRKDKEEIWQLLRNQLQETTLENRQISVLMGYISACAEQDPEFYNRTLDGIVGDELLGEWFPILQTASQIDKRGVERLQKSLELGRAKLGSYHYIAYGRAHELITDDDLAELLLLILSKQDGIGVAVEILNMRFHGRNSETPPCSSNLINAARKVLSLYSFPDERGRHDKQDYELNQIAVVCLDGEGGSDAAEGLCRNIVDAIINNRVYSFDYPELFNTIARLQPRVFLYHFLGDEKIEKYHRKRIFESGFERHINPLNQISDKDLLSWCDEDPEKRYAIAASSVQTFSKIEEPEQYKWKSITHALLSKAPKLTDVLESIVVSISPSSWSGSLADILQKRSILLESLFDHEDAEVGAWAKSQFLALQEKIRAERVWEESRNRGRDESFE
jgi:hypothetical protein